MLFLTPEQLEGQCVFLKSINVTSQIQCSNKLFIRGPKFTKRERQAAIDFVRKCLGNGIFCFIQDNQSSLVVWTENQDRALTNETASLLKMKEKTQSSSCLSKAVISEVPEVESTLDNLSKSESPQNHKHTLKKQPSRIYRGVPY
ncbi:MAG: hypothetical protein F6K14_31615 [Symploca sp. SIO2C1]|nr:hypothetical protein [Symploca sp. SIO2C1]